MNIFQTYETIYYFLIDIGGFLLVFVAKQKAIN